MNINVEKIKEIYGMDTLSLVKDNIKIIIKNIKYLEQLGYENVRYV